MTRSMTGYGRREGAWSGGSVAVELRSVNHRFCEIVVRLPKNLSPMEEHVKGTIQQHCQRGRIEAIITVQGVREAGRVLSVDRSLARQYYRALHELKKELGIPGTIDLAMLAHNKDIIAMTDQPLVQDARLKKTVHRLLGGALSDLDAMRRREGQILGADIQKRIEVIEKTSSLIEQRTDVAVQNYFQRLKVRINKFLDDNQMDPSRLGQELAVYAERCDVTEEITRLGSHLLQFKRALKTRGSVGKTLDFLLQEMGREVNTIGSKANDTEISMHIVKIKGELEKIREQVQNIE